MPQTYDDPGALAGATGAGSAIAGWRSPPNITARSNALQLRPYQLAALDRIDATIATGKRRVLLVAPTGSGKTVIAAAAIQRAVAAGQRVLVLAHRREIIGQTVQKLYGAGVDAGVIQAGHPMRLAERVQVSSIATLHARAIRGAAIELPEADLVIVDEAHHIRARTYQAIIARYPEAMTLGLTATPVRGDGRGLGSAFDALVEAAAVGDLIRDGYLVRARVYAPSVPDLTGIHTRAGDYVESELAARVDTDRLVGDAVEHWLRLADRRRTVVFGTGVKHSLHLRDEFRRAGVMAEHLDGSTPADERDAILRRLASGEVDIVCNAMVLTEGWDCPDVSCLILARPTKSLGLYLQMIGRVLRPAPGKADALILDHSGAVYQHGLPDEPVAWSLREDSRAESRTAAMRRRAQAPALVPCPECGAVRWQGQPCPACGWRSRGRADAVEVVDGELGEVDRHRHAGAVTHDAATRRRWHAQLAYIATERGYKSGWAAHKYREKFGTWPADRHIQPVPPDAALRSWVRSRQIAFAKGRAKAGVR